MIYKNNKAQEKAKFNAKNLHQNHIKLTSNIKNERKKNQTL